MKFTYKKAYALDGKLHPVVLEDEILKTENFTTTGIFFTLADVEQAALFAEDIDEFRSKIRDVELQLISKIDGCTVEEAARKLEVEEARLRMI